MCLRFIVALLILLVAFTDAAAVRRRPSRTAVIVWNDALLEAVRSTSFPPPLTARALGILHTCIYDAWAAFDPVADGVYWTESLRQPPAEHTIENQEEAIDFAAFTALVDLFPPRAAQFEAVLAARGHVDPGRAGSVGLTACASVLASRHADGSNQLGDLHAGAYSDYTGYVPVNTLDTIVDPNRWQPLATASGPQQFLAPHWGLVSPFALQSGSEFQPPPPPTYPHGGYRREANEVLHMSARLDDRAKMIAEYWWDGPSSETPPGHWSQLAGMVSERDRHTLTDDVRMFFALGNALLDTSIASWTCKRYFDSARPITAIRFLYGGQPVHAWGGPGRGRQLIDGSEFRSFLPTPPFAEYVSGHSTFSAASAEILRSVTGSDAFVATVTFPPGSSRIEPGLVPARTVTLRWNTFSEAADEAGLSRRYGGIHFRSGDLAGRHLGRLIGARAWEAANGYLQGTANLQW